MSDAPEDSGLDEQRLNLRFLLRAYTNADAVRLAAVLAQLAEGAATDVARSRVVALWSSRWPRHAPLTGSRSIRSRISWSLGFLHAAGVTRRCEDAESVTVADPHLLALSASNIDAVLSEDGHALEPSLWRRPPTVPADLQHVLDEREPARLAARAQREPDGTT